MNTSFFIAGVQFRPKEDIEYALDYMEVGRTLILEPEPDNKYDSNAIKIMIEVDTETPPIHLGYVPGKKSAEVTLALRTAPHICRVEQINPTAPPWGHDNGLDKRGGRRCQLSKNCD